MNYSNKMKEIRTDQDITQQTIADYLNISAFTYSHYETQDHIIPLKHLNNFCNYFNTSIDYVLGLNSNINYKNSKKEIDLNLAGIRLKKFRQENKLTQSKLADKLNVARTMITQYELGKFLISTHSLYTISNKYHISADYLLGKIDKPKYLNKS